MKYNFAIMKKFVFGIVIAMTLIAFAMPVYANSPAPADHLRISIINKPENIVFVDLLIKIDSNDENYVSLNKQNLELNEFTNDAEILTFNDLGFESFTFHYKNANSNIKLYTNNCVDFCKGFENNAHLTQYEDLLTNYNLVKLAFLNDNGDVVFVSEELNLPKENFFKIFRGFIEYEFGTGLIYISEDISAYSILAVLIFIAFSAGLEVLTATVFRFKENQIGIVAVVNVITQIFMRLLYLILPFTYLVSTIVLETFIYLGEFLLYKKLFKNENILKLLIYTIIANTISLVFGIIVIKILNL